MCVCVWGGCFLLLFSLNYACSRMLFIILNNVPENQYFGVRSGAVS